MKKKPLLNLGIAFLFGAWAAIRLAIWFNEDDRGRFELVGVALPAGIAIIGLFLFFAKDD